MGVSDREIELIAERVIQKIEERHQIDIPARERYR